jgi:hypothetical protein
MFLTRTVYVIAFVSSWVSSSQEDYFAAKYSTSTAWFYTNVNSTIADNNVFLTRYIVYETFNMTRVAFAVIGWLLGTWLWWSDRKIVNRNERTLQLYHDIMKRERLVESDRLNEETDNNLE